MLAPPVPKPPSVPADRVYDIDIYDTSGGPDFQAVIAKLAEPGVPEVVWTPQNGGHWIVTRGEFVHKVLQDFTRFSSRSLIIPKALSPKGHKPVQLDPPEHGKFRALLIPTFSPKRIAGLATQARQLTIELIDGFKQRGSCEFIGELAQHLPIVIFMKMVDLPEQDRVHLMAVTDDILRATTPEGRAKARVDLEEYTMAKIRERRANPGPDLISELTQVKMDGELIDDESLYGLIGFLMLAGLDTVASTLGFFARFLALNPEHRRQLVADPPLVPNAVEELLRRFAIVLVSREVMVDTELGGVQLMAGDMLSVPTMLGGIDASCFIDPLEVDFKRPRPIHTTFGDGPHRCMGSLLARMELRIFLEEWLARIPDFEIAANADVEIRMGAIPMIPALPLVWKV
jgi:cytochrome P450